MARPSARMTLLAAGGLEGLPGVLRPWHPAPDPSHQKDRLTLARPWHGRPPAADPFPATDLKAAGGDL